MLDRTKKQKGMTLVIMMLLVPILLAIGVSYVDPIVRSFRATVNDQKTLLAKSVADSMFEIALWESRGGGTGEITEGCIGDCVNGIEFDFGTATGTWKVIGSPEVEASHLIDGEYTVPAPGSGDAGSDYCSTAEPVVDVGMLSSALGDLGIGSGVMDDPLDWPCHWNKIREGQAVAIPLYVEEGGFVKNPGFSVDSGGAVGSDSLGLTDFQLRFRNPCNPENSQLGYEICNNNARYVLKEFEPLDEFTVILLWNVTGEGISNGSAVDEQFVLLEPTFIEGIIDENIKVEDINAFNIIKDPQYWITQDTFTDFEGGMNPISIHLNTIHKPVLNLLAIHTLEQDSTINPTIPYLEYQFKAPIDLATDSPISSTSKVVRIDVMIDGGYSETLERTIALPKPVSGFVIQQ